MKSIRGPVREDHDCTDHTHLVGGGDGRRPGGDQLGRSCGKCLSCVLESAAIHDRSAVNIVWYLEAVEQDHDRGSVLDSTCAEHG